MPKLKPDTQRARRENILAAAEHCFAAAGFHRTTMQDICRAAAVSPGALYVYFDSKEALIAGIAERDRAEFAERFAMLAKAPDVMKALTTLGESYFVDEPAHKRRMCVEIGLEAARNPRVAEIHRSVDAYVQASFEALFQRLKDEGRIAAEADAATLASLIMVIGDGMFWRRAVMPSFDAKAILPAVTGLIGMMLRPVEPSDTGTTVKVTS